MEKIKEKDLIARAKKMYFDRNPNIKEVFCDEFGRFSYDKGNLLEINKLNQAGVFSIKRGATKSVKTDTVEVFDNDDTKNKYFGKKNKKVEEKNNNL